MGAGDTGPKLGEPYDLDSMISPIYALTTIGAGGAGWMGYKAIPVDEPKPRSTMFLIDIGLSPKTLDAMLHILIICLVLFIIINYGITLLELLLSSQIPFLFFFLLLIIVLFYCTY